jgi:alcohol-forming fatty acyl-CoA reductase
MDRVMKEIYQNPCFEKTSELSHFLQMIKDKIYPIQGDICKDNLQLSDADKQMLIKDLDIIINCAASVDFNEQISDSININYLGCLGMLDSTSSSLARKPHSFFKK